MRKLLLSLATVAVVALFSSCGGNGQSEKKDTDNQIGAENNEITEDNSSENAEQSGDFTSYKDDAIGVSFSVPAGLEKYEGPEVPSGSVEFRLDKKTYNSVSVFVREKFEGEFDQAAIDEEYENATLSITGTPDSKEKVDGGYTLTESSEDLGMYGASKVLFKGNKQYSIKVSWKKENESKYGGEVAKQVLDSFKIVE